MCLGGSLTKFILYDNNFIGNIPRTLRNCSTLSRVRIDDNQLSSNISEAFGVYPSLIYIELSHNKLYGELSSQWVLSYKLITLKISRNNLSSVIPVEMARIVACCAACVLRALEGDISLSDLNEGIKPRHNTLCSSYTSTDYDALQYNEDIKKFRKMALATSQEYGSSDQYSNPTSEYGLNSSGSNSEDGQTREMETEMGHMKKDSIGFSKIKGFNGNS
ncbi:Proline-rich receptor-like protein kinase PERK1 [Capsicum chinense]|nr:Proline-rich receptor-like protein kinase PERK1 [Capsicum chinense]